MQPTLLNYNLAEIQVSYKTKVKPSERRKITTSKDAESVLREVWNDTIEFREEFYILLLNRANQVLGWYKVSAGGITGTVVDPKLIFSVALKGLACSLVLAHNHPSGNLQPSSQDIALTQKLKQAGEILEIPILDHLILSTEGYYSFGDEGIL
jgi:DNA repair protein RadC